MEIPRPAHIDGPHWEAIQAHKSRIRAQIASDHGGVIGACKDLVECVAKVVLAEATSPEIADFPKLVKKASTLLGSATPKNDGEVQAATLAKGLTLLISAQQTAAQGLSELRNDHGAGHGKPTMPVIADEDVQLVRSYTEAWVRWALARLERLLANSVSTLIAELTGTTFRAGLLAQRLEEVGFKQLPDEELERLGFAVAERGVRRDTFVVAGDGVEPLEHEDGWPIAYQYGVAKGLLLTSDGVLRPIRLSVLAAIVPRLGADLQVRLLDEVETARIDPALRRNDEAMNATWTTLGEMSALIDDGHRARWQLLVDRLFVPF
ncbi:abortive infection family protein [Ilumatobacter coccineus]|nr:abortive infection family protein [Ilumatobacter coccineus]